VGVPRQPPTWVEIERFCEIDGWRRIRSTGHTFFQKVLDSGEVLETHVSFSTHKGPGRGRFQEILRHQLKVSRAEFWRVVKDRVPADRPSVETEPDDVPTHPVWVVEGLKAQGYREAEIGAMAPEEAEALLRELWAKRKS
jgi:hypothetical protein